MRRLREALRDPDPRELLRWIRRGELVGGIALLTAGLLRWDEGVLTWLLIGLGLVILVPWPGAWMIRRRT